MSEQRDAARPAWASSASRAAGEVGRGCTKNGASSTATIVADQPQFGRERAKLLSATGMNGDPMASSMPSIASVVSAYGNSSNSAVTV